MDTSLDLADVAGLSRRRSDARELFEVATESWGTASIRDLPMSDVSPDGSPVEFALAMNGDDAPGRVRQGLERFGCGEAWPQVRAHAARGFGSDQPVLFAIDLAPGHSRRVKVYLRHHDYRPSSLARNLSRYRGSSVPRCVSSVRH